MNLLLSVKLTYNIITRIFSYEICVVTKRPVFKIWCFRNWLWKARTPSHKLHRSFHFCTRFELKLIMNSGDNRTGQQSPSQCKWLHDTIVFTFTKVFVKNITPSWTKITWQSLTPADSFHLCLDLDVTCDLFDIVKKGDNL